VQGGLCVGLPWSSRLPEDAPDNIVRNVTENARTLKFSSHSFEKE